MDTRKNNKPAHGSEKTKVGDFSHKKSQPPPHGSKKETTPSEDLSLYRPPPPPPPPEIFGPERYSIGRVLIEAGTTITKLEEENYNQEVEIRNLKFLAGFAQARIERLEEFIRAIPDLDKMVKDPELGRVYDNIWGPWCTAYGLMNRQKIPVPTLTPRPGYQENKNFRREF
ncbi:hypothetical protein TWF281_007599 [Arthrobotrys megalospora]